jgi:hypothetical protein
MVAFAPSNIPATVTTVEELAFWCASILAETASTVTIQTSASTAEPAASVQTFRFANQTTNPERAVVVLYLPLTATWRGAGKLFGEGISVLSTNPIPSHYTAV